MQWQIQGVVET